MKILVIEDNERLRRSLCEYLREEGFAVDIAGDGEEGLYKATSSAYDVIVLDVMIPVLDGFTVLSKLRAAGNTVPVIHLTARGSLADRLAGLNGGADDYIVKPFEMAELVARVKVAMRRSRGAPNPRIQIGPICLDTAAKVATVNGASVELTAREYALLEMLATKPHQVVSREEIYERLYDENDESTSNLVEAYIYRLRQKFGKSCIETRRGMGYQFAVKAVPEEGGMS